MPIGGSLTTSAALTFTIPGGGNVLNGYTITVPVGGSRIYNPGTGPGQANKVATLGGTTTISTPVTIDLTAVVCVDGAVGMTHVRELVVENDDATNILKLDFTVTNSILFNEEAAAKIDVQPGSTMAFSKPLGTNGFVVDGTHKIVTLDPGAAAIPYKVVLLGD